MTYSEYTNIVAIGKPVFVLPENLHDKVCAHWYAGFEISGFPFEESAFFRTVILVSPNFYATN